MGYLLTLHNSDSMVTDYTVTKFILDTDVTAPFQDHSNVIAVMVRNYLLMDTVVNHSKKWRQRAMVREKSLLVIVFMETVLVVNVNAPSDGVDQNVTKV